MMVSSMWKLYDDDDDDDDIVFVDGALSNTVTQSAK